MVTSTSAPRGALVLNRPPKPDPITTTWCRSLLGLWTLDMGTFLAGHCLYSVQRLPAGTDGKPGHGLTHTPSGQDGGREHTFRPRDHRHRLGELDRGRPLRGPTGGDDRGG